MFYPSSWQVREPGLTLSRSSLTPRMTSTTDFASPSVTLQAGWHRSPSSTPADLLKLESDSDPTLASYQTAFYPDGFRRASSYVGTFVPKNWSPNTGHLEQWILPGWDCLPQESCAATTENDKARWTTDTIQFAVDMSLPVQENLYPPQPDKPLPMASVAATLGFAATQRKARIQGNLKLEGIRARWFKERDEAVRACNVEDVNRD